MQNLRDFFIASSSVSIMDVIINIILASAMSQLIYVVFIKLGSTFSNRKQFGKIFFLVTVCTTLIISVIQASLALSLGLVGALSIVRFRTAIKEPEELAYVFFCITMGLGFGANARGLSIITGFLIIAIIVIKGLLGKKELQQDTYNFCVISAILKLDQIIQIIRAHSSSVILRRIDNEGEIINTQLIVEFLSIEHLQDAIKELKMKDSNISTSFISTSTFM